MPLTHYKCKPMLPVANRPAIDYTVSRLRAAGVRDITFALGYRPRDVVEFTEGYADIRAEYSVEDEPLGTAGAVRAAARERDGDFIVCSADTLSDSDIGGLIEAHERGGGMVTIETTGVSDLGAYGEVISEDGVVRAVREKLPENVGRRGTASTGTYIVSARALAYVPENVPFDFARELFPYLLRLGKRICEHRTAGYWRDMGSLTDYFAANYEMREGAPFPAAKHIFRCHSRPKGSDLVADGAIVLGLTHNCIIGEDAVIESGARLESCIVLPGERVTGRMCNCVIGRDFAADPLLDGVNLRNVDNSSNIFHLFASINL